MRFGKVVHGYLAPMIFVLAISSVMPHGPGLVRAKMNIAAEQVTHQQPAEKSADSLAEESTRPESARPKNRAESVRALVSYAGLGKGAVIADIGAGNGKDTWVFAEAVSETGRVFAEEIGEDMVQSLKDAAEKKSLSQVAAVLGRSDDPCLPADSIDLAYMNRVYHHFAKPAFNPCAGAFWAEEFLRKQCLWGISNETTAFFRGQDERQRPDCQQPKDDRSVHKIIMNNHLRKNSSFEPAVRGVDVRRPLRKPKISVKFFVDWVARFQYFYAQM